MPKFPVDARKEKVLRAFTILGFKYKIRNHIHFERDNGDGTTSKATLTNDDVLKGPTIQSACRQAGITRSEFLKAFDQA